MPFKDRQKSLEYHRQYYKEHADVMRAQSRVYGRRWKQERKQIVLSHYGKGNELCCCWPDCFISDIDLLTLDHIKDDGYQDRPTRTEGGHTFYQKLIKRNFPKGFQTLCWNHQWKKRLLLLRSRY